MRDLLQHVDLKTYHNFNYFNTRIIKSELLIFNGFYKINHITQDAMKNVHPYANATPYIRTVTYFTLILN